MQKHPHTQSPEVLFITNIFIFRPDKPGFLTASPVSSLPGGASSLTGASAICPETYFSWRRQKTWRTKKHTKDRRWDGGTPSLVTHSSQHARSWVIEYCNKRNLICFLRSLNFISSSLVLSSPVLSLFMITIFWHTEPYNVCYVWDMKCEMWQMELVQEGAVPILLCVSWIQ